MADLTTRFYEKGYATLVLGPGYTNLIKEINRKRHVLKLPLLDEEAGKQVWKEHVKWYFERYNPKNPLHKTQKSYDSAMAMVSSTFTSCLDVITYN